MNDILAAPQQQPDGVPFSDTGVVIADAIAALSRTNLRSVRRVLQTISLLQNFYNVPPESLQDMIDPASAPLDGVQPCHSMEKLAALPEAKQQRINATFDLVEAIEDDPAMVAFLAALDEG